MKKILYGLVISIASVFSLYASDAVNAAVLTGMPPRTASLMETQRHFPATLQHAGDFQGVWERVGADDSALTAFNSIQSRYAVPFKGIKEVQLNTYQYTSSGKSHVVKFSHSIKGQEKNTALSVVFSGDRRIIITFPSDKPIEQKGIDVSVIRNCPVPTDNLIKPGHQFMELLLDGKTGAVNIGGSSPPMIRIRHQRPIPKAAPLTPTIPQFKLQYMSADGRAIRIVCPTSGEGDQRITIEETTTSALYEEMLEGKDTGKDFWKYKEGKSNNNESKGEFVRAPPPPITVSSFPGFTTASLSDGRELRVHDSLLLEHTPHSGSLSWDPARRVLAPGVSTPLPMSSESMPAPESAPAPAPAPAPVAVQSIIEQPQTPLKPREVISLWQQVLSNVRGLGNFFASDFNFEFNMS